MGFSIFRAGFGASGTKFVPLRLIIKKQAQKAAKSTKLWEDSDFTEKEKDGWYI